MRYTTEINLNEGDIFNSGITVSFQRNLIILFPFVYTEKLTFNFDKNVFFYDTFLNNNEIKYV